MDTLNLITFAIALTSLLGAFIVPILNNRTRWIELKHQTEQDAQKERINFLRDALAKIVENAAAYIYHNTTGHDPHKFETLVIIKFFFLSIPDERLHTIGNDIEGKTGKDVLAVIDKGIVRLGELINQEMKIIPEPKSRWRIW